MKRIPKAVFLFFVAISLVFAGFVRQNTTEPGKVVIVLTPDSINLMTQTIQRAIDSCAGQGGGTVVFSAGTYPSGSIELKSNVTLQFEKTPYFWEVKTIRITGMMRLSSEKTFRIFLFRVKVPLTGMIV
ncbi:MAG: hypothetical protein HC906_08730 [Bacteroidales bacterium]|nr:hypothetical protein [Bacteroidales bacterium]